MSRYALLTKYLKERPADLVRVSFADIERIIGRKLPDSATTHRAWWSNNPSNNVMTRAWLDAGFQSEKVDLAGRTLVFRRAEGGAHMAGFEEIQAPFSATTQAAPDKLALFGWLHGTVTVTSGVDLCAPADPNWADMADSAH